METLPACSEVSRAIFSVPYDTLIIRETEASLRWKNVIKARTVLASRRIVFEMHVDSKIKGFSRINEAGQHRRILVRRILVAPGSKR